MLENFWNTVICITKKNGIFPSFQVNLQKSGVFKIKNIIRAIDTFFHQINQKHTLK